MEKEDLNPYAPQKAKLIDEDKLIITPRPIMIALTPFFFSISGACFITATIEPAPVSYFSALFGIVAGIGTIASARKIATKKPPEPPKM